MHVWRYLGTALKMYLVMLGCRYAEIEGYKQIAICNIYTYSLKRCRDENVLEHISGGKHICFQNTTKKNASESKPYKG